MDFMNGTSLSCDVEEQFVGEITQLVKCLLLVFNTCSNGYLYTVNMYNRHTKIT